jgi:diguanylate cyclase (GGDEF)-like protein/PAS domain S-box-containing protein
MAAGVIVTKPGSRVLWLNGRMAAVLRTTPEKLRGAQAVPFVVEGSREAFEQLTSADPPGLEPVELTLCADDGTHVQVSVAASRLDLDGETLTCLLVTDITAQKAATQRLEESERRFHTLVQHSSDAIGVVDRDAHLTYVNPAYERMGLAPASQGYSMLDFVHPDDSAPVKAAFAMHASVPGPHPPDVFRLRTKSGEWRVLEVAVTNRLDDPAVGGLILNARDVTERVNLTRALRTLGQGNQVLVHATDEASLLADTCRTIVNAGGYRLAWAGYAEHDEQRTVRIVGSAGHSEYLEDLRVTWDNGPLGQGPTGRAIRTGNVQVVNDIRRSKQLAPWQDRAEMCGLRSSCVLPLRAGGTLIGTLQIYAAEPRAFDPAAVDLLRELADDLAYGIGRVRDAAALQASEERFRALADASPIGIFESLPVGRVGYANSRMAEICGRSVECLLGLGWTEAMHPNDLPKLRALVGDIHPTRATATVGFRIVRPGGEVRQVRMSLAPIGNMPGGGRVGTVEDVTEEVRAQEALGHQAFHDSLTGLPNRALFLDRLNQELTWGRRDRPGIAVLFLDLDRFKVVNDSLGHEKGDAVLRELGGRFACAVRTGETAARFSGDEFIFIIRDVHEVGEVTAATARLLKVLEAPVRCAGQDLTMTGSIGIVVPGRRAEAASVLRDAETAMYQAKAAGGNTYALFDKDLHRRSVRRLAMEGELRQALARDEFELYYQPGLNPATGDLLGTEALIRWHHPKRGPVPPLEFIPVAEDCGLIKPIGKWVLEQAVAQLAAWDAGGPHLGVLSVNVSARQLDDRRTPAMVGEVLERHGVDARRVCLEVTESAVMAASEPTRWTLGRFKELGVRLAIDDFGTGYSSLAYLHALPVTTLKIDRSFIGRLGGPDDSTPVVRAIVDLAHAMGLIVVAEGVEEGDERRRAAVAAMGCDVAQGFYWAPALPPREFAQWCAGRRADAAWPPPRLV